MKGAWLPTRMDDPGLLPCSLSVHGQGIRACPWSVDFRADTTASEGKIDVWPGQ